MDVSEDDEPLATKRYDTAALDHAWDWFKCHADQRIALFRFYVVVVGGLAAGLGVLHQQRENIICAALSVFAAFVCFCFVRLDKRTSDLVRLGERAMRSEERKLAIETGNDEFDIALKAESPTGCWLHTYRRIIRALLLSAFWLFVLFALISVTESRHVLVILHSLSGVSLK
jgi:hypothetical protein